MQKKGGSWQETVNHDEDHDGGRKSNIKLVVLSPALELADIRPTDVGRHKTSVQPVMTDEVSAVSFLPFGVSKKK
jgi:hypothetical protein